ncbi:MAG: aminofutalosine synthase MqnE, partial [Myxococcales bacterium]|nr:aminofutalosine synthase MqnE [Myxococcales bacterium]
MNLPPSVHAVVEAAGLGPIAQKALAGERLDDADAITLFESPDVVAIGLLANVVREHLHGEVSWFNRNQHINATNVCEASCIFCSFSRLKTGDDAAYTMTFDQALDRLKALRDTFVSEVHIVNGLNPDLPFDYYPGLLKALKAERPDLHIKGFTAVEIHYYAQKYGMTVPDVLEHLRAAGLDSLPGGGAEIFADRARRKLCHDKVDSDGWLDIHRTAHRMGFRTNATMLFGSIETLEERVDHMRRLRELQDETGGFQTFIPLKFHNENNRLRNVAETTDTDCWKTLAIARLYLDNFPHIKAYWPMMGIQVAQVAQMLGVSDIDGTVREERIYHMAGAKTPQGLTRPELIALIERAGRKALERDTLYGIAAETPALLEVSGPAAPTRIAGVGYLNAWPLTAFIDREKHTVLEDVPSAIATTLAEGSVDVALVPVAAILTEGDWRVVPGMAIGADGPVESVLLVAETEPEQWTEVLLDGESRTSAVLAQILLTKGPLAARVGELTFRRVGPGEAVPAAGGTVAAMVIGDRARDLPGRLGVRFDLPEVWKAWTGLPFVFAVWAGRPGLDPRIGGDLREAARRGRAAIAERFTGADRTYLQDRLRYDLDDRALMGLRRFAALGREAGFFTHGDVQLLGPESD